MIKEIAVVTNQVGLHARPASEFVRCASRFHSDITICKAEGGTAVNAKSIIKVLSQGFVQGTQVELCAQGEDETEAVEALLQLIASGLEEAAP